MDLTVVMCRKWQQVPVCLELVISECQEMIDPSEVHLLKNLTLHWHQRFDKHYYYWWVVVVTMMMTMTTTTTMMMMMMRMMRMMMISHYCVNAYSKTAPAAAP
nr:hypothetical protein BaRGS_030620 [Batillaria attramentaria]